MHTIAIYAPVGRRVLTVNRNALGRIAAVCTRNGWRYFISLPHGSVENV